MKEKKPESKSDSTKSDKEKRLSKWKRMPLIKTRVRRIKDSNLVLHETIISDIKPLEYYEALVNNEDGEFDMEEYNK